MFVCGPTVQGPIHLGHARTYIFYDVVARYLSHLGFKVEFLMNVTDVDERVSAAAAEADADPEAFASRYLTLFLKDLASLGVSSVTRFEPVSDRVGDAINLVKKLVENKHAYVSGGWVYFDTATFPRFGRLSHQSRADLALRPLELSPSKRNLADFSLWRPEVLVKGKWASPWGVGSPGWHIQDTAITLAVFGPQYDIHGGAYELIYPHHEAEIAQGESITGVTPMVKYWVHTNLVTMAGEKMSKSIGNVYTVRDALKSYPADAIRLCLLSTHYRKDMDLSGLEAAHRKLGRLRLRVSRLSHVARSYRAAPAPSTLSAFHAAMNDDFNTPLAIRALEKALEDGVDERNDVRASGILRSLSIAFNILGVSTVG